MGCPEVTLVAISVDDPVSRQLEASQIAEMHARYGDFGMQPLPADQFDPPSGCFLVAWVDGGPLGCGGYRALRPGIAEIKRMYVQASMRRQGLGRLILAALERLAQAAGYQEMWLETGTEQPEAMATYPSHGYRPIPSYTHEYADDSRSRCFAKDLSGAKGDHTQPGTTRAGLLIRQAKHQDIPVVVAILTDAARNLANRGIEQWPVPFPKVAVAASVERSKTYLAFMGAMAPATLSLSWDDPAFWSGQPPDAGYVHRLAVARVEAGRGLGAELLDWAGEKVAKAGRQLLRLDCETGILDCGPTTSGRASFTKETSSLTYRPSARPADPGAQPSTSGPPLGRLTRTDDHRRPGRVGSGGRGGSRRLRDRRPVLHPAGTGQAGLAPDHRGGRERGSHQCHPPGRQPPPGRPGAN